jgi:hypothetical protein
MNERKLQSAAILGSLSLLFLAAPAHAVLIVTSTEDGASVCPGASCTLRQAIAIAPANDTIMFQLPAHSTIALTGGELPITRHLTITGPGADLLTVQRSTAGGTNDFRIFSIAGTDNANRVNVTISGLTIANGKSVAVMADPIRGGGGIYSLYANLTVNACAFTGNASPGWGGAIFGAAAGTTTINNSTFSGNSASAGGAIATNAGVFVNSSTISGNSAVGGGGIFVGSTVGQGQITVTSTTIAYNTATNAIGGGIWADSNSQLTLRNSIVALNSAPDKANISTGIAPVSQGFNLIGVQPVLFFNQTTGDQLQVAAADVGLDSLKFNGGPTQTHALVGNSKAVDTGHSSGATTDQRGFLRPVDSPVILGQGDGSDVGAYEVQPDQLPGCQGTMVTNTGDPGPGSLRAVVASACSGSTITFAPNVRGVIALTEGEIPITKQLSIVGPGANLLSVERSAAAPTNFRIFNVGSVPATISGLTIAKGLLASGNGAGILSSGTLTLIGVAVTENVTAAGNGGGIRSSGTLNVIRSTLSGNSINSVSSGGSGGAIFNFGGILNITSSTLTQNSAIGPGGTSDSGGAIFSNVGTVTITSSTIARNFGDLGGGIRVLNGGTVHLKSSIVALNTSPSGMDIKDGPFISDGYNLIGDSTGASLSAQLSDQVGNAGTPKDPKLGELRDNGGPTMTLALLPDSTAIDQGTSIGSNGTPLTDQRGFPRTYDDSAVSNNGGNGTDIGAFELAPPVTLDIDGSVSQTRYDPFTDGVLAIRYMFGVTGPALIANVLGATASRNTPEKVTDHMNGYRSVFDIDGDGTVDALTDGLLIVRYLLGVRGTALLDGVLLPGALRGDAMGIEAYLAQLTP